MKEEKKKETCVQLQMIALVNFLLLKLQITHDYGIHTNAKEAQNSKLCTRNTCNPLIHGKEICE